MAIDMSGILAALLFASATDPITLGCERRAAEQRLALATDPYADVETFTAHPAVESLRGEPRPVDVGSNRYARLFRTRLRQEVTTQGVNFAGAYSLVNVGMTGWGANWYIVDRRNGLVTLFPYHAAFLDFRADSDLIVMNPRREIEKAMHEPDAQCSFLNQQEFTSLRPFYFLWRDGQLRLLGPTNVNPPLNRFWDEYSPPRP